MAMNVVILSGRLTRDPEIRYTPTGKEVGQFTLALDRRYKSSTGERYTDFIPCVNWGASNKALKEYVHKGQELEVEGRLEVRTYEKDGVKRYVTEVIVERFHFIGNKRDTDGTVLPPGEPTLEGSGADEQAGVMDSFGSAVPFDENIPF